MANQNPISRKRKVFAPLDQFLRRIMDLFVSSAGMILLSPLYLAIVMLIKRESRGPAIVKEERVGRYGRVFFIRKFRTLADASPESDFPEKNVMSERRITSFGRFLQETKLDNIPQLWNVFTGDLSLVGPQSEDPQTVNEWPDDVRREMLAVRPGLTSPAAVLFSFYEKLLQSQNVKERSLFDVLPSRHRLNQLYLRRRSIVTDLDILFWTALSLLPPLRSEALPGSLRVNGLWKHLFDRRVFGFLSDLMVAFLAAVIAGSIIPLGIYQVGGRPGIIAVYLLLALMYSLANLISDSHNVRWDQAGAGHSLDLAISLGVVTLLWYIVFLVLPVEQLIKPSFLALSAVFAFIGFVVLRYRKRLITALAAGWVSRRGHGLENYGEAVLIAGAGETGRFSIRLLRDGPLSYAFNVVGIVDDDASKHGSVIEGVKVIGTTQDIPELSKSFDIGLVFFAISEIDSRQYGRIASLCRRSGVRMIMVPDMLNQLRTYLPKDDGEQVELIGAVLQDSTHDRLTGAYNRPSFIRHVERLLDQSEEHHEPCAIIAYEVIYHWPDGASHSRAITSQVLQVVADRTSRVIREMDIFGRCAENEFALLLPGLDSKVAGRLTERLKKELTSTPVWTNRGPINISLNVGVSSISAGRAGAEELLEDVLRRMRLEPPDGLFFREETIPASTRRKAARDNYGR